MTPQSTSLSPFTVLLIEDSASDARLFEELLEDSELEATSRWESSLEDGLRAAVEYRPSVVVVDLGLPDSQGMDSVARIASRLPDLPLVVLTGRSGLDAAAAALDAGASEYLRKDDLTPALLARTLRLATERQRLEREARRQRSISYSILNSLPEHVAVLDPSGTIVAVNDAWAEFAAQEGGDPRGYEGENYLAETKRAAGAGSEDALHMHAGLRAVLAGAEERFSMEYPCHGPDEKRWYRVEVVPLRDHDDGGAVVSHVNITERKLAELRVEDERARLAEVFENAPSWVATFRGPDHVVEMANPAYRKLAGDRKLVGRPVREVFPELEGQGYVELLDHVYETGEPVEVEEQPLVLDRPGEGEPVRFYLTAVAQPRTDDGAVIGVIAQGVDVTEQVEARREAEDAEEKWSTAIELAPVGITISEVESGRVLTANRAAASMLGYEPEEMIGATIDELDSWIDREERIALLEDLRQQDVVQNREVQLRHRSGGTRYVRTSARRLELAGRTRLLWTLEDVTEERKRRERLALLENSVEATRHGIMITDRQGTIRWVNPAFEEMTGYGRDEVMGENPRILKSGEQDETFYEELWTTITGGEVWDEEIVNRRKDGSLYLERESIVPVRHRSDEITHFVAIKEDITERRKRQEALRRSEARYRTLVETMAEATLILDTDGHITFANEEAEELLGLTESKLTERTYNDPDWRITDAEGEPLPDDRLPFRRVMETGRPVRNVEHGIERPDRSRRVLSVNAAPLLDEEEVQEGVVATIRDVTERKQMEEQLRHQALHDGLTDLPNRTLFADRLEQALARGRRHGDLVGLLMLDVDRFKQINDHLGHTAGDRTLEELARRLQGELRGEDTAARLGGDEFAVLLPGLSCPADLENVTDRIMKALTRPFRLGGKLVEVDVTLGGVLHDGEETELAVTVGEGDDLLRYADLALFEAKKETGPSFHLFDPRTDLQQAEKLGREQELRRAIRGEEFDLEFQPIYRCEEGRLWGVEPLARWQHPERGVLGPGEFIPLAEETGLIQQLGELLFRMACEYAVGWPEGEGRLQITMNVSGRELDRDGYPERLQSIAQEAGLTTDRFSLEITETAITRATEQIERLRKLGFGVLVDDFGTGYSSFHYLRDLTFDGLKIDMSFVQAMTEDSTSRGLVETMVNMGRNMGMTIVAEGIETEEQKSMLLDMNCELGQGFLLDRPMSAEAIGKLLTGSNPDS